MDEDSEKLIVRQSFLDRSTEKVADLKIERYFGNEEKKQAHFPDFYSSAQCKSQLAGAALFVNGAAMQFLKWTTDFSKHPNTLAQLSERVSKSAWADPNLMIMHGYWRFQPASQVLLLEIEESTLLCDSWNFQLNNYWMESLDYDYFPVSLNRHTCASRPDKAPHGKIVLVICSQELVEHAQQHYEHVGKVNLLTSQGHSHGTAALRMIYAKQEPKATFKLTPCSSTDEFVSILDGLI
jgi:hypothetical protein